MAKNHFHFAFEILHKVEDGKHMVWFITPPAAQAGFPSKAVEFTEAQWNELRYHFGLAVDDVNKCDKLTYIA
jgi:hypothetical protein